jgi:hypothetical protein
MEVRMPAYRLQRLDDHYRLIEETDVSATDDQDAIAQAIALDDACFVDIWRGEEMVSRVCPGERRHRSS